MILKYGTYSHDQNEAAVTIERQFNFNEAQQPTGYVERWIIDGMLQAADQSALTTAIGSLKTGYGTNGLDLGLYLDNGTTLTSHAISSASTQSGTRVVSIVFPVGTGAEYSTFRTYRIVVEAEVKTATGNALRSYSESITFQGTGGPIWRHLATLNGQWPRQTVHRRSTYTVQQRGQAIGVSSYPNIPGPIWPDAEHQEQRTIERGTPERIGNRFENYPVSWSYVFESNDQLNGIPGNWPG